MFGNLGSMFSLLTQAHTLGGKFQAISDDLRQKRVTGAAAGGLVEVEVNGLGEVLSVRIDPKLKERGDLELLEDLIPSAVNQAVARARELHAESMKSLADGVDMSGVSDLLSRFTDKGA